MSETTWIATIEEQLKGQLHSDFHPIDLSADIPVLLLKRDHLLATVGFLKNSVFAFLTDLTGIHFPQNKGAEFGVVYHLHDLVKNNRLRLKVFVSAADPSVPSLTGLFPGANWMERETFDFFGIVFKGHPNLKRILNMDEMNYHPMRKEFRLEDGQREDKDNSMFGR